LRRGLFVPSISLTRRCDLPLHCQVRRQIAQAIRDGTIPNGARLPSSRVLAHLLGISRNTVLAAFDNLVADGLLHGERGAGMRVENGAPAREVTWYGLREVIRAAGYPARVVQLCDPDGNQLYLRY